MNKLIPLFLFAVVACNKKPSFSVIPKINLIQMDKQELQVGIDAKDIYLNFYVEDGDGDIGSGQGNFFFKDSRDSSLTPFTVPAIPEEYSPDKGIRGNIVVLYPGSSLQLREDTNHLFTDTLQWEVFLVDKAGNKSNLTTTNPLILKK